VTCRVGILLTHPVQYQVPLWRKLAAREDLESTCFFFSDQGTKPALDPDFGETFKWDVPLLDGYRSQFLTRRPISEARHFAVPKAGAFFAERRFRVVLLHGYSHAFARQAIRAKRRDGYKVVLHGEFSDGARPRARWKQCLRAAYLNWFYRRVDHFCPIGRQAIAHLHRRGIPGERMTLTPYSVDDELLERQFQAHDREDCRRCLGIGPEHTAFLFSGKLIHRKRPLVFAEAALAAGCQERLAVIILGSGEQAEAVRRRLAPAFGRRLIMPGFVNQSELGRYFRAADVLVLPSSFETWGLVVNEAMQFGLPCIVSDRVGCHEDLILPGKTGFVVPHNVAAPLAERMEWCVQHPEEIRRMAARSREHIRGFTSERAAQGLAAAILKVA